MVYDSAKNPDLTLIQRVSALSSLPGVYYSPALHHGGVDRAGHLKDSTELIYVSVHSCSLAVTIVTCAVYLRVRYATCKNEKGFDSIRRVA